MAVTNAINLYIATCRCVIESSADGGGTPAELHRHLPHLRQSLSCCVCAEVLHAPVGPPSGPCQHHVCRGCAGGRMRLRPRCGWCRDASQFVDNAVLRTVVRCFGKLCQYLAASPVVARAVGAPDVDAGPLMAAIRDGLHVRDDCAPRPAPQLAALPPKPRTSNDGRPSDRERNAQLPRDASSPERGEGRSPGSGPCAVRERVSPRRRKSAAAVNQCSANVLCESNDTPAKDRKHVIHVVANKPGRKRKRTTESINRDRSKQQPCTNGIDTDCENILSRNSIYETVAAEHDYNKESVPAITTSPVLKVRIRKVEGDHESLIRRPKLIAEAMLNHDGVNNSVGAEDELRRSNGLDDISNNNETLQSDTAPSDPGKNKSSNKKKITGCRCGLATQNPGKLTCCGQRCPCYSSFKGCVDCKCRGCRNPRGDKPSPHSLKAQLQQQKLASPSHIQLTSPSHIQLTSPSPQLILTPVKMDNNNIDI